MACRLNPLALGVGIQPWDEATRTGYCQSQSPRARGIAQAILH